MHISSKQRIQITGKYHIMSKKIRKHQAGKKEKKKIIE